MLINIAICDKSHLNRKKFKDYLTFFSVKGVYDIKIFEFNSSEQLFDICQNNKFNFEFIIIDIQIQNKNFIETVFKLRNLRKKQNNIIFIANNYNHILDSFDVHAVQFFLKNITYNDFSIKFQVLLSEYIEMNPYKIISKTSTGDYEVISLPNIISIETDKTKRSILIVKSFEITYNIRNNISSFYNEIKQKDFYRIHRSIIINFNYVKCFHAHQIEMTNGDNFIINEQINPPAMLGRIE